MPIYEYRCQSCGHELEALQKISDDPLSDCPQCDDGALKRLVSAAAFRLKGGGWYETDFKKGNKKNLVEDGTGKGGDKKESSDSGSSDKKSESKSTSKDSSSSNSKSSESGKKKSANGS